MTRVEIIRIYFSCAAKNCPGLTWVNEWTSEPILPLPGPTRPCGLRSSTVNIQPVIGVAAFEPKEYS